MASSLILSGVPQWAVLGPLMFLLCINDISQHLNSPLRLFADDCCIELLLLMRILHNFSVTLTNYRNGQLSGS